MIMFEFVDWKIETDEKKFQMVRKLPAITWKNNDLNNANWFVTKETHIAFNL